MTLKLDQDLASVQEARETAARAAEAQRALSRLTAEDVDRILAAMAGAGSAAAGPLARLAVEETGMGLYQHKLFKNKFTSSYLYRSIRDIPTVGVIWHDRERKVLGVAEPVGVVAALVPVTGPVATVFQNSLIAMKGRNAIVFAPHPRSVKSSLQAVQVMEEAAVKAGAPRGSIQGLSRVTLAGTNELMRQRSVSLVLGTGGAAMVRAAYGSGKPAVAVGPGNVPAYVDRLVDDLPKLAGDLLDSKTFDNGTPCASEQAVVAHASIAGALKLELRRRGAHFLNADEKSRLGKVILLPGGALNPEVVGRSPEVLGRLAGLRLPPGCRALVAETREVGPPEPFSAEILAPVMAFYQVKSWREGLGLCNDLLEYGGIGHTCGVWTGREEVIAAFSAYAKAFRVLVNCPGAFGAMGYLTGLNASIMMGTGTWGGSITSENVGPLHLINVRQVAYGSRQWEGYGAVENIQG